jgi:hypothetical protein
VAELAVGDQLRQRADGVLDRRVGVHAVLVVEVDVATPKRLSEASQACPT